MEEAAMVVIHEKRKRGGKSIWHKPNPTITGPPAVAANGSPNDQPMASSSNTIMIESPYDEPVASLSYTVVNDSSDDDEPLARMAQTIVSESIHDEPVARWLRCKFLTRND